jgi:maltoporin
LREQTSIWAGKRFYNRFYLEMWDFFLFDQSGAGFGVEKLPLGFGQAELAFFRHFNLEADSPVFK